MKVIKLSIIALVTFGVLFVGATYFNIFEAQTPPENTQQAGETDAGQAQQEEENTQQVSQITEIEADRILSERVFGDPSAPIRITEFSSFTCGHCANFHTNTYPRLVKEYIDTGKAYLVFSDFPLNAPALHASIVARCLPEDNYYDFVQMLFKRQSDWAYEANYLSFLRRNALRSGLSEEKFEACLGNEDIQKRLLERMRAAQTQWEINSTPSLVINNKTVISGALGFEEFDKKLKEITAPSNNEP